jgi:CRP-like cAMP-binding protein
MDAGPAPAPSSAGLRAALERIHPLTASAWTQIEALLLARTVSAGEHLLRAGEHACSIFFVRSGLLREYYLDEAGRESTRRFCEEGEFSGSLADLLAGGASMVCIEALTVCELWEVDWPAFDALTDAHPCLMKLMRRFAEALYVRKMTREFEMLTLPALERYRRFARDFARLDARLPRHMVASYLGITPIHLSRICGRGRSAPVPAAPTEKM